MFMVRYTFVQRQCFFQTKLLTYCRFSLPSLVQVYNFVSGVFDRSYALAIVEFDCLRLWTGVFYTDNKFKQVPLIQWRTEEPLKEEVTGL